MNTESQQEQLSGYDSEWALPEDDSPATDRDAEFDQQSADGTTIPNAASAAPKVETSDNAPGSPAVGNAGADIWANATEEQRMAFRRAENEKVAAAQRAKLNEDRLAERGRELKALREEKAALEEAQRVPTEFEQQHEQYAKDIDVIVERKLAGRLPPVAPVEQKTEAQVEQEVFNVITQAHPDAGDLYNSTGCQALLAQDPVFKHAGRAYLFSEALHSDDPNMAVAALSYYKSTLGDSPKPKTGLESLVAASSVSGKSDMRTATQLTEKEKYDREWELD